MGGVSAACQDVGGKTRGKMPWHGAMVMRVWTGLRLQDRDAGLSVMAGKIRRGGQGREVWLQRGGRRGGVCGPNDKHVTRSRATKRNLVLQGRSARKAGRAVRDGRGAVVHKHGEHFSEGVIKELYAMAWGCWDVMQSYLWVSKILYMARDKFKEDSGSLSDKRYAGHPQLGM